MCGVGDSSDPSSGVDFKSRNEGRISVSEVPMLTAGAKAAFPLAIIAWVFYLALLFSLLPSWITLSFTIGSGLAVTETASTFKLPLSGVMIMFDCINIVF